MAIEIVDGSTRASARPALALVATAPLGDAAEAARAVMVGAFASHAIAELPHWRRESSDLLVDECMQRFVLWTLWDQWKWERGYAHVERIDFDEIAERVLAFNDKHGPQTNGRRLTTIHGGRA